jgi:2-haloacid dehalogenase
VTRNSLQHALRELKLSLDDGEISSLMKAYDSLSTFPDVPPALKSLSSNPGVTAVVFSNGTSAMVTASVTQSPDLSPHASTFQDLISIEVIKMFKPTPEAYMYLAQKVGKEKSEMGDMFLISGNPFDVVGARATGMKAIWVDRPGNGWVDALVESEKGPTAIVRSLEDVPSVIEKYSK